MIIENIISDNPVCLLSYSLFGSRGHAKGRVSKQALCVGLF